MTDSVPPAARIIDLYQRNAGAWAAIREDKGMERPWLALLLAELRSAARVLDVGCGIGEPVARILLENGCVVTGIDASLALMAMAQQRLPDGEWIVGDMREMALGRRFDGIVAWHSLFHLTPEDQKGMFARFAAHLGPGGLLLFTSGDAAGVRIGSWQGEPLYHASLAPEEYRALLSDAGFETLRYTPRAPACGDATVWLARRAGSKAAA